MLQELAKLDGTVHQFRARELTLRTAFDNVQRVSELLRVPEVRRLSEEIVT